MLKTNFQKTLEWRRRSKPLKRMKVNTKRSPIRQGKAQRSAGASKLSVRKPMNKIGPKTRAWLRAWAWLKPRLEAAGRTGCEFKGIVPHDCWGEIWPCHSKKRRLWEGDDIYCVALGCQQVAGLLDEAMAHVQMERTVWQAINANGGIILPKEKVAA